MPAAQETGQEAFWALVPRSGRFQTHPRLRDILKLGQCDGERCERREWGGIPGQKTDHGSDLARVGWQTSNQLAPRCVLVSQLLAAAACAARIKQTKLFLGKNIGQTHTMKKLGSCLLSPPGAGGAIWASWKTSSRLGYLSS